MASLSAVLILTVVTFAHSHNSSDTHAIRLPTDVNNNRHVCSPNPCDPGGFCVKCHADSGPCRSESDRQKGFVCVYPHANYFDEDKISKSHPIALVHRKMAVGEKWLLFKPHRSAHDHMISPHRSPPNGHICDVNPFDSSSICLNCDAFSCPTQTSKNHLCLCQLGEIWQNCDDPAFDACEGHTCLNGAECVPHAKGPRCLCQPGFGGEICEIHMANKTCGKVPENICAFVKSCKFGRCEPKSDYPGYKCHCDAKHMGINCDWEINKVIDYWAGGILVAIVICWIIVFCSRNEQ